MRCSFPWFLSLILLIFSCRPEEDNISPLNVAKSYEHVQVQQQKVEQKIEIMANRYLDETPYNINYMDLLQIKIISF